MKKALSLFLSLIMVITSICLFPLGSFASENSKNFKAQNKQKGCNNKLEKVSASGYQIQYGTNKKFKNAKKITIKKCKTTSKKITKLKKGKKYYFRIRAYKTQGKKKVYGAWSNAKNIKVK